MSVQPLAVRVACFVVSLVVQLSAVAAFAVPNLDQEREALGVRVFSDDLDPGLFYLTPGDLELATDSLGRPQARLTQVRYVGTRASSSSVDWLEHGLLSVTVQMSSPDVSIPSLERALSLAVGRPARVRALPIARLESALAYSRIQENLSEESRAEVDLLRGGHFESADREQEAANGVYWRERTFQVRLGALDSQVLWDSLQSGRVLMNLGYAFFASGVRAVRDVPLLSGHPALVAEVSGELARRLEVNARRANTHLVRVGALAITLDVERWPGLLARYDLNERLPAGFPILDVYCYDFHNRRRDDLALKRVELRAESPVGEPVLVSLHFDRANSDIYAVAAKFPFAVRVDRPYFYRTMEVGLDGSVEYDDWRERESWSRILDVSSRAPSIGAEAKTGEEG